MRNGETEQLSNLAGRDNHSDTSGKPDSDRERNVLDVRANAQQADSYKNQTCDESGERQAIIAVPLHDAGDETDEGARGPADLKPAAADKRNDQAADDCGVEASLWRHPRSNGDGHR